MHLPVATFIIINKHKISKFNTYGWKWTAAPNMFIILDNSSRILIRKKKETKNLSKSFSLFIYGIFSSQIFFVETFSYELCIGNWRENPYMIKNKHMYLIYLWMYVSVLWFKNKRKKKNTISSLITYTIVRISTWSRILIKNQILYYDNE